MVIILKKITVMKGRKKMGLCIDGDQVCLQPLPQSALCPPSPCSNHRSVSLQLSTPPTPHPPPPSRVNVLSIRP